MIIDIKTDNQVINDALDFLYNKGKFGFAPMKYVIIQLHPKVTEDQSIAYCQFLYVHDWIMFPSYLKDIDGQIIILLNEKVNNGLSQKATKVFLKHGDYLTYIKNNNRLESINRIKNRIKNAAAFIAPICAIATIVLTILQIIDTKKIEAIQQKQQTISAELDGLKRQFHTLSLQLDSNKVKKYPK